MTLRCARIYSGMMTVAHRRRAEGSRRLVLGLVLAALLGESPSARAGSGDLDGRFGVGGRVLTPFAGAGEARAVAIAADGGIVVAGDGGVEDFAAVVRYDRRGELDERFGVGGRVLTPFAGAGEARAVAITSDGKIVVVGDGGAEDFAAVVRYDERGELDPRFGVGGRVLTPFVAAGEARDVAITAGDGIVVVGDGGDADFAALIAYDAEGRLDPRFGVGGRVLVPFEGAVAARKIALAPDGGIVAVGDGGAEDFAALMRFQGGSTSTAGARRRTSPPANRTGLPPVPCPPGPALTTIRCRFDSLLGSVASELPPGSLRDALAAPLVLARARVQDPALAPAASRELAKFGRQLRRHRRRLPPELHRRLLADALLARADLRLLRAPRR